MKIEFHVSVDVPQGGARRVATLVVLTCAVLGGSAAVASAYETDWIEGGEPMTAQSFKDIFDAIQSDMDAVRAQLDSRVGDLQSRVDDLEVLSPQAERAIRTGPLGAYTINGLFCGATSGTYDGAQVGGYQGAKAKCETESGCSTEAAHMCTTVEMVQSVSLGVTVQPGDKWVATGLAHEARGAATDCGGWTNAAEDS